MEIATHCEHSWEFQFFLEMKMEMEIDMHCVRAIKKAQKLGTVKNSTHFFMGCIFALRYENFPVIHTKMPSLLKFWLFMGF